MSKSSKCTEQATIVALPCIIGRDGDRDGIPNALMEAMYMQGYRSSPRLSQLFQS